MVAQAPARPLEADPAQFIRDHLPLEPVAQIPQIRLHRANGTSGLSRLADATGRPVVPYWAWSWGGGLALARYILDHPDRVRGRRVLDLGTGGGIVAIAAAKAGAGFVRACDTDPYAIAALELNAIANRTLIASHLGDLTAGSPPPVDLVLVGDLFYDATIYRRVTGFLDRCLVRGAKVLIGDPWRRFLPHSRLRLLADIPVVDFAQREVTAGVFAFEPVAA